ncbi:MAG: hypothetical protein Q9202_007051 [Teloschistes flavicans]
MEKAIPPLEGNQDKAPAIIIVATILVTLTTSFVLFRFAVRFWIVKAVGWDDWTILFAEFGAIIGLAFDYMKIHYGFGRPDSLLDQHQLLEFAKYSYGQWIQNFATLMWTKVSICLFLLRIPVNKALVRPLQGAVVFLIVSNVILTILWIAQCRPIAAAWDKTIEPKLCFTRWQLERIILSQAIISVVSDFMFATYPILILWNLQMRLSRKVLLCCLMGAGYITGACCIGRTVLNFQAMPKDKTFGGVTHWMWRAFEVNIGIMAACAPALLPGFRWLNSLFKGFALSRSQSKSPDEVHLKSVERKSPENDIGHRSSQSFGNEISIVTGCVDATVPANQIRKTSIVEVEHRRVVDHLNLEDLS